jgi:glycosyltransferase involved in cell wall biosynthesis
MRIEGFDIVLSSTTGFAHHVRPRGGCHIAYCHAPPRFLWNPAYRRSDVVPAPLRPLAGIAVRALRRSDRKAASGPHATIANSMATAERLRALYGREATIIHPPVDVTKFRIAPNTRDEFLLVSRLLDHKNVDVAVRAFSKTGRRLIVAGDGPARPALESIAGPTVEFRGALGDEELATLYGRCRGVVVTSEEEFGITPLEANASGRPVVALRAGGTLETVIDGVTGILYAPANPAALLDAVERAAATTFDPDSLRAHAEQWSESVFAARLSAFIDRSAAACMTCERAKRADPNVRHLPFRRHGEQPTSEQAAVKR